MHCQFGRDKPGTAGARLGITRVQGSTLSNQRALTVSEIFTVMRLVPVRWGFRASNETVIRSRGPHTIQSPGHSDNMDSRNIKAWHLDTRRNLRRPRTLNGDTDVSGPLGERIQCIELLVIDGHRSHEATAMPKVMVLSGRDWSQREGSYGLVACRAQQPTA